MSRERVPCTCDACGRRSTCPIDSPAPSGWFYVELKDDYDGTCLLACTEECKASMPWRQQRGRASVPAPETSSS